MTNTLVAAPRKSIGWACIVVMASGLAIGIRTAGAQEARTAASSKKEAARRSLIYDRTADAKVQLAKAVEKARHDDRRILLMFGGDWCGWCHKLHGLFKSDQEIARVLSYEYVLVTVDTEAPHAAELLETCKAALSPDELKKGVGYPFLAVLDKDGKVITAQRTDPLEVGDHHDPKKVAAFLNRWKVTAADAHRVLDDALARASSEDKRVLLTFGAPWCGWCHRLHDWLAQPEVAAILDRDLVIAQVDIDRMTGGKDIMKTYRPDESGGIPWFAILDARGKALVTSNGPKGNIGYPAAPEEIDHFLAMLRGQARHIDPGQLDRIRRSLETNAERIRQPAVH